MFSWCIIEILSFVKKIIRESNFVLGSLTDKSVLCTLVGLHVSFRETLSLHISQNETIFRIHNLNAEVWPTRVYCALLSVCMSHSGRHCHCMSPRMRHSSAFITWMRKFDRQECTIHSCRSKCILQSKTLSYNLFEVKKKFNYFFLLFIKSPYSRTNLF